MARYNKFLLSVIHAVLLKLEDDNFQHITNEVLSEVAMVVEEAESTMSR